MHFSGNHIHRDEEDVFPLSHNSSQDELQTTNTFCFSKSLQLINKFLWKFSS